MKVYNDQDNADLTTALRASLDSVRARRLFDAPFCLLAKTSLLNAYARKHSLKACVVGVSGGVDSALVLALAVHASRRQDSPIRRVIPVLMPVFARGATRQREALSLGADLARAFGLGASVVDLTQAHAALTSAVDEGLGIKGQDWADGQAVSYARAPALYYAASLLAQEGLRAVVLGTTNRDEGAYLGYFGKAADGMADIQLISDLHKSEVYKLAEVAGVPAPVLEAIPSGDMYDGRCDTDVFGTSYDFVELYLSMLCMPENARRDLQTLWSEEDRARYEVLAARLEKVHAYNAHKYLVGSPAIHLDVYPSAVPQGWAYGPKDKPVAPRIDNKYVVGPFEMPEALCKIFAAARTESLTVSSVIATAEDDVNKDGAHIVDGLLSRDECGILFGLVMAQALVPVGASGVKSEFNPREDLVGSFRASCYAPEFAKILWDRLAPALPGHLIASDGQIWRATGINALLRFIRYENGGRQITHYDAPFDYGDGRRTMKSLDIYLTDYEEGMGGLLRFIRDPQKKTPVPDRDFADWTRMADASEVLCVVRPKAGRAVVFGQRTLHDGEILAPGAKPKMFIRTDIVYERLGVP